MQNIDFTLLEFATKGKKFLSEVATQTTENYYSADFVVPFKVLKSYYFENKDLPSYDVAYEYAAGFPNVEQVREILKQAYFSDKNKLTDGDFPFYIKELKKEYNDAYIRDGINHITKKITSGQYVVDDLNEYLKKMAVKVTSLNDTQLYSQGTLEESAKQRLLEYKRIKDNPDIAKGVMSGFKQLDAITNGFKGSELILISGPSGSGKSILLMNMAVNAWLGNNKVTTPESEIDDSGKDVWFISIENTKDLHERRVSSCLAGVSSDAIRDGKLLDEDEQKYYRALKFQHKYKHKKFYTSDFGKNISMAVIEAEYEKLLHIFKPQLIVIDYLGKMKAVNPTGQDWLDQGSVAMDMYEFAKVIKDIPIISASQMKSAMRTQNGLKRFTGDAESIARSKMIGDNVSMNLQIVKDENFNDSSYMELVIAKNRDGKTGDSLMLSKEFWRSTVCDPIDNLLIANSIV